MLKGNSMLVHDGNRKHTGENPLFASQVDLASVLRSGADPPEELELGVLLKGKIHHIFEPSESGKTMIALWVVKRRIEAHQRVVVFDAENGIRTIAERLQQMRADYEQVEKYLVYLAFPDLRMGARTKTAFADLLDEINPMLVVFDSWASFLVAAGLSENENADVEGWDTAFTKVAKMKGIASLIIDHTPHEHDRSRGAARKREVADVQWFVKKTREFDRDVVGEVLLINKKDREGWLRGQVKFSIGGRSGRLICERTEGTIRTADPVSDLTPKEPKVFDTLREKFPKTGARASEWQRATKKRGVPYSTHYRAVKTLVTPGPTRAPLVSLVNGTDLVHESPNSGKGSETREPGTGVPIAGKSQSVSHRSHETNETVGGREVSPVSPPYKGETVRPDPGTTGQRHSPVEPGSEWNGSREGKAEGGRKTSHFLSAPSSIESVEPENDVCRHGYAGGVGCYCCDPDHPYRNGAS